MISSAGFLRFLEGWMDASLARNAMDMFGNDGSLCEDAVRVLHVKHLATYLHQAFHMEGRLPYT
jgi:hypothetical protein